jgi:GNAT superfamily N-acetyltransferase
MSEVNVRFATARDAEIIKRMIHGLAQFQSHGDSVRASTEVLREQLESDKPPFECLIAECNQAPVGFALFYAFYSTWEARSGLYLEDLFVSPSARGTGVGKVLLERLALIARERGCTQLDWMVQRDNHGAQSFYASFGARIMPEWTRWRYDVTQPCAQSDKSHSL